METLRWTSFNRLSWNYWRPNKENWREVVFDNGQALRLNGQVYCRIVSDVTFTTEAMNCGSIVDLLRKAEGILISATEVDFTHEI